MYMATTLKRKTRTLNIIKEIVMERDSTAILVYIRIALTLRNVSKIKNSIRMFRVWHGLA